MVSRKEVNKINQASIGLAENVSMEHAGDSTSSKLAIRGKNVQGKVQLYSLQGQKRGISTHAHAHTPATSCRYYSPQSFCQLKENLENSSHSNSGFSLFHTNIRSLKNDLENFQTHLLEKLDFHFNIIGDTKTTIKNEHVEFNPLIPNYNFEFTPTPLPAGRVGMYIDEQLLKNALMKLLRLSELS